MERQSSTSGQRKRICVVEDDDEGSFSTEEVSSSHHKSLATTTAFQPKISSDRFANDRKKLLKIFPQEVWQLIFEKFEHFHDLEKVRNCSLFFRQMLLGDRVKLLFYNVWGILRFNWPNKTCARNIDTFHSLQNHSYFPDSEQSDSFKEELKLRLVCASWSKTIDKFYERGVIPFYHYNSQRLGKILPKFEATHGLSTTRNPFIGRSAYFIGGNGDVGEFVNLTHSILDKYGHHFWHFIIILFASVTPAYTRLREILQRMPSVKTIHIRYYSSDGGDDVLTAVELQEFRAQVSANPLPVLQELQECTVMNLPKKLLQQFTGTYGHVCNFKVAKPHYPEMIDKDVHGLYSYMFGLGQLELFPEVN